MFETNISKLLLSICQFVGLVIVIGVGVRVSASANKRCNVNKHRFSNEFGLSVRNSLNVTLMYYVNEAEADLRRASPSGS